MKTVQGMANECADATIDGHGRVTYELDLYGMERFAALVRAQALDEAAAACMKRAPQNGVQDATMFLQIAIDIAALKG